MDIDYRYLKAFSTVAKYLNFSRAAEELRVAQSAVSRQVKLLEEGLGKQLIIRSSKSVVLSDVGKSLLRCIKNFENMASEVVETNDEKEIRIGVLHGLLENWLVNVVTNFSKKHANPLKITISSPQHLKELMEEGKLDLAFLNVNVQSDLVSSLKLFEEKYVLISKGEISLKDLEKYNWIVYDETDPIFKLSNKVAKKVYYVQSMTSILSLVKANVGIAYVPKHILNGREKFEVQEVKKPHINGIYCSTLNFQSLPKHLENFIDTAKKSIVE